jgi:glutamate mutase epsilon subunit
MPFPKDVLGFHEDRLRERAGREGVPYDHDLAVTSVYEISESLDKLIPGMSAAG